MMVNLQGNLRLYPHGLLCLWRQIKSPYFYQYHIGLHIHAYIAKINLKEKR